jgi:hypothetical protein
MKQVPDRKKLRREYLQKRGGAVADVALSGLLIVPLAIACVLFLMMAVIFAFSPGLPINQRLIGGGGTGLMACLSGIGLRICIRNIQTTRWSQSEPSR